MWEQIGILILIGLVSLVDWAIKRSRAQRAQQKRRAQENVSENPYVAKQRTQPQKPSPQSSSQSSQRSQRQEENAQDMRRFLEALGLPTDQLLPKSAQAPIPRPEPRVHPTQVSRQAASPPPPLPSVSVVHKPTREQARIASQFERAGSGAKKEPSHGALRNSFQGRAALRQAIVAREVLGPPLALRGEGLGHEF